MAKLVDLTMTVSPAMHAFPGSPGPQFIPWAQIDQDGYGMELLFMSSHTGTHMDAPSHFAAGGRTIDMIPPGRLACRAALIRASAKAGCRIGPDAIRRFEKGHGRLEPGSAAVFFTGWSASAAAKDPRRCYLDNPGLSAAAARLLASRRVSMAAIDSPSIDCGTAAAFPAHHILCKSDVLIVENLANLKAIKQPRFYLAVLPLKLRGATGSPVRALASQDRPAL